MEAPETRKRFYFALAIVALVVGSFAGGYGLSLVVPGPSAATVTVIDDFGRTVSVPDDVQRLISLTPSTTEIVFALGLEERLVAVDAVSDYPAELAEMNLTRIGTYPSVALESVVAMAPDLVVVADIIAVTDIDRMAAQGIAILVLGPKTLNDLLQDILLLGLVTDTLSEAEEVVDVLQARIDAVTEATAGVIERPMVYLEFYPLWTFGPGSFGQNLIIMAGGRNAGADLTSPFGEVTNEFVIAAQPDVILYTKGIFTETTNASIAARQGWSDIPAVQNDAIHPIDDNEVSRTGPRLVDALEDMVRILHPELFE